VVQVWTLNRTTGCRGADDLRDPAVLVVDPPVGDCDFYG
jgi:hypothetical protein